MRKIAVLLTVFNRKNKTLLCLDSLMNTYMKANVPIEIKVFITDDGCTDGTSEAILRRNYDLPIKILMGDGSLYWNAE